MKQFIGPTHLVLYNIVYYYVIQNHRGTRFTEIKNDIRDLAGALTDLARIISIVVCEKRGKN